MVAVFSFVIPMCSYVLPQSSDIDPRLMPIVQEFFFMKNGRMGVDESLSVRVGDLQNPNWVGLCKISVFGPEVVISTKEYDKNMPMQLHSTVLHELSHCVLGRGHYPPETFEDIRGWKSFLLYLKIKAGVKVESHMKDGCPVSIMYPYSFSDYCYVKNFSYYMDELFERI